MSNRFVKIWLSVLLLLGSCVTTRAETGPSIQVGSVVLHPMLMAEVPAQQTGLLQEITVAEGEQVKPGQVLASLDARQAKLAVARAKLEHAQAEAKAKNEIQILYAEKALEVAKAELERSSESIEKFAKSISESQLDVERLTVEKLTLERQQAEHELVLERFGVQLKQTELEAAQLQLDQHQIKAPFAGTVVLVRGRLGEWVEDGTSVLRLVAVDRLRGEGFLAADQASNVKVGQKVEFALPTGKRITGTLKFVSPEMEPVTRQVRIWAEIPNSNGALRPGQQGSLEIASAIND